MRILVTGGAGFIGSHLCEALLKEGNEVVILDDFNTYYAPDIKRENIRGIQDHIEIVEGDIRDAILVERTFGKGKFDAVVHLAARAGVRPSISSPKLYFTTNIDGTFNLLDACRYHEVPDFIFASSSSVYGVNEKIPFAEDDPIKRTISPYAATKLAGEQICSNYSHLFGIRSMCLRFFTVYGPRQRPDLAISKFTKKILNDETIQQYGDGSTARDYTYIDDIIAGILGALRYEKSKFEIFNLGGSQTTTLSQLISLIEQSCGKSAKIEVVGEQPGDVPRTWADVTKAGELLGYAPETPIEQGIQKYVEWVKSR
ncbi:MAG: GDP-mannose 4,6-dehydratase [Verrucomicrobiota bacterium JB023]|nr:GDP-mannose 4,6-dehydratase [Verrucomicrobiota bacterium JB023]